MNLDDRLRSAYQFELDEARRTFDADRSRARFGASSGRRGAGVLAAAALLLVLGGVVAVASLRDGGTPFVRLETSTSVPFADQGPQTGAGLLDDASSDEVDAGAPGAATATVTPTPSPTPSPTPEPAAGWADAVEGRGDRAVATPSPVPVDPTPAPAVSADGLAPPSATTPAVPTEEAVPTATALPTATVLPTATPVPTLTPPPATATPEPTSTAVPTAVPTATATATAIPTSTATPSPTPEPRDAGATTSVCASGRRAQLEFASLSYVTAATGWGRLYDLVDEQDGPYYFNAWEPGFTEPVTVELVLREPALAADIRVHQDPFTPVSGTIDIDVSGLTIAIGLAGTDGWQVHDFGAPTLIERFTISRDAFEENVMEVMICLAP